MSNFVVPKNIVFRRKNTYLKSISTDYFPSLTTKIIAVITFLYKQLIHKNILISFSSDSRIVAELVNEIVKNRTESDDAMIKLVQVEDFTNECKKAVLPPGKNHYSRY